MVTTHLLSCYSVPCPPLPRSHPFPFTCYFPTWNSPSSHPTGEHQQMPSHLSRPILHIMPAMPSSLLCFLFSLSPSPTLSQSPSFSPFLPFYLLLFSISKSVFPMILYQILYVGTDFTVLQLYVCVRLHVLACNIRFHVHYQVVISLKAGVFITYPIFYQLNSF